jgi:type I restriction enzyme, S subunit
VSRYTLVPLGTVLRQTRDELPVELDRTYRMAGVYSFGRGLFARPPIAGTDTKYRSLFRLHEGQFVMSRLKAWEGAVAVVSPEFHGLAVSQEYPTFDIDRERADPAYVGWLCRWERFWESLLGQSKGLGARRDRVHPDRLLAVRIPLPSLDEQRRLGALAQTVQTLGQRAEEFSALERALVPSVVNAALRGDL